MSLTTDLNAAHDQLTQALSALIDAQRNFLQIAQQGNQATIAAFTMLTQALSAPRQIIEDDNGNPIGVMPVLHQEDQPYV